VGGYSHPPNADAAVRLMQAIMPIARRRNPNLRLRLVGDKPTLAMARLATRRDQVTGTVADVQPYLDEAALVALPLRLGGGMRVKLLEALAAGKAIVASPLAARGLELADGRELVLAETDEEFAEAIVTLIADPDARRSLAQHAREWALQHLDWESRVRRYEELYRCLSGSRNARAVGD
jgi:glycosyltransferase involved in cell wall biosynthesis